MRFLSFVYLFGFFSGLSQAETSRLEQNLHLLDQDPQTGFQIFRASQPNAKDMVRFCKLGITEMMVLSGDGDRDEQLAKRFCPTLRVVWNQKTSARVPLDRPFLQDFDRWVAAAKAGGKKIAFRCYCGCHRTGRLAAYYQMRHQGWTDLEAIRDMHQKGKVMFLYPELDGQVRALYQFVRAEPCRESSQYCVRDRAFASQ